MHKTEEELLVLEEGVKSGVVQACCTSGPTKL